MLYTFLENKLLGGYWGLKQKFNRSKILKPFLKIVHKGYQIETNSYLPLNTIIKGKPNFPHGMSGVFISGDAEIGKNCTIFQQVTIGSNMLIDSKGIGAPKIGDNCLIGVGAKLIGGITIGNNCRVGANCVVTENIPDNCTVVLNKAQIIQKEDIVNRVYLKTNNGWGYTQDGNIVEEKDIKILEKLNSLNSK